MTLPTVIKVLTQKKKGGNHYQTELTLDWSEVTYEDLLVLARNALVHEFQARVVKGCKDYLDLERDKVPEKFTIRAKDWVDLTPVMVAKYTPQPPNVQKLLKQFLDAGLTPEDIKVMLGE